MIRFNNNIMVNNFKYNITRQDEKASEFMNKVSSHQKHLHPHESPNEVRLGMMFRSAVEEYGRYESNISRADAKYEFVDAKLSEVQKYLQRINELVVQGSNGTYTSEDRQIIANEVDEYLRQIVQVANTSYFDGEAVFGGNATNVAPFQISEAKVEGAGKALVSGIEYKGDLGKKYVEISRGEYVETAFNGNEVFWAKNVRVKSNTDGSLFVSNSDQTIRINGIEINISEGDNIETVVDKINATNVAARAEVVMDNGNKYLAVEGTKPHEIWMEDVNGGTVLQNLGVIAVGGPNPPGNYSPSAEVKSESVFDKIIRARDALYNDGAYQVGNSLDGVIKDSIGHIAEYQSIVGTKHARIKRVGEHISKVKQDAQEMHIKYAGMTETEFAKVYTDLKNIETMRNATLQLGARIMPRTLLDFLR
jgi:flagellar hook-associated protein 3 FlgL